MLGDDVQAAIAAVAESIKPGFSMVWRGSALPEGRWLWEDGSAISRTTYAELFAAIGTTYGAGNGTTTFNLPDSRGRVDVGRDNMGGTASSRVTTAGSAIDGATLGASGGAQNVTLTSAQIPAHSHPITDPGHSHSDTNLTGGAGGSFGIGDNGYSSPSSTGSATTGITVGNNTGGGQAHTNMQPSLVGNKVIRY